MPNLGNLCWLSPTKWPGPAPDVHAHHSTTTKTSALFQVKPGQKPFFSVSSNQLLCSRSIYKEELIYFHRSYAPYEERSLYLKASFHSWHWIINTWNTIKANWQEQTQHYLRWSSLSTISKIMKILPVVFFSPFLQICHFTVRVRLSCSG